uniref:sterol 22-desaturase n=1 Tax=Chlamydomonas leiostraca TaxID=1034604 RepID=A0A6T8Q4F7_9CHLO|mmetsp:Transcript_15667/g.39050  ORF Transcript_15667/g.39050 Transcript_15667/m.39050 type:complete len:548 (+) Transcript_15667:165-1808(+)
MGNSSDSAVPTIVASAADGLTKLKDAVSGMSTGGWVGLGVAAVAGYCVYEQMRFARWRRCKDGSKLPGPDSVTPILGGIVEMVKDPYGFWERQRLYTQSGLSWNSLVGTFTVFVTDPAVSRHVFNSNSKDTLLMALHPSAANVLGERNIAFLHGPDHKALRKSFLALFTRRALSVYIARQDQVICAHLKRWLAEQGADEKGARAGLPTEMRVLIRDMNAWTSQEVFAGPYLDDPAERDAFGKAYMDMTDAFLAFPLCVPGTAVWKGRQGRLFIIKVLTKAAARSKAKMATGAEPECLLDFWSQQVLQEIREAQEQGVEPPFYSADAKMADSVMDFLFASQDASTASLVWLLTLMAEYPDTLARVREEQRRLRPDPNAPITGDVLNQMEFTRQVVKEALRFRPAAPMVPQTAQADFPLTDNYTAPKGSMIIPSVWAACHQGYEAPHTFDPDRFGPERKEDVKFAGNYLVFGHGPHYCVGREYATNHLMCFLARLALTVDYSRVRSKVSDEIKYLPTLYPGDSVFAFKWATPTASQCGKGGSMKLAATA